MVIMVVGGMDMAQPPDIVAIIVHDHNVCLINVIYMVYARPQGLHAHSLAGLRDGFVSCTTILRHEAATCASAVSGM